MKKRKSKFLAVLRILGLFVIGLVVAVAVTLSRIDLESIRKSVLSVMTDTVGAPVLLDGAVSWRFSLRPHIELNEVKVANPEWAKSKYAFTAKKVDVRLNLISLFRDRPTIQNIRVYDATINIEQKEDGSYSLPKLATNKTGTEKNSVSEQPKFPFRDAEFGGLQIKNLTANVLGNVYSLAGFNIRKIHRDNVREYSGWIKADVDVLPFVLVFSEYNTERKIYPVQVALATGGDALIANVALEGKSKLPIDFILKGDLPEPEMLGKIFGRDLTDMPVVNINVAGGFDRNKISIRKSTLRVNDTKIDVVASYDWGKKIPDIYLDVRGGVIDLQRLFPKWYVKKRNKKKDDLNVFHHIPLFGTLFYDKSVELHIDLDRLVMYMDFSLGNLDLSVKLKDNRLRADIDGLIAGGVVDLALNADLDKDGRYWLNTGMNARGVQVGNILAEIGADNLLSDLPTNVELYVQANGTNLSEIMQTITGPVKVYSVGPGYAYADVVAYMYGTDFLTSLRHNIQDLFSSEKKYNQMEVSCFAVNAILRNGRVETQNGVAIETNAINIRLLGMLDLGQEKMQLSLTTVPVRGIKLSLTGNIVNSIELTGKLAMPDIKISGAAVAGKVASATGLGLLLAPFTGGIGLVAGTGVGLLAGDLLENWLADDKPCQTAKKRGAPLYDDDPEWLQIPVSDLINSVLDNNQTM